MRDTLSDIDRWLAEGEDVALATVIETWGSSPRGVGSRMGIHDIPPTYEAFEAWTAEFECRSWSQFSLKYILANPAVTCVLAETTNPAHMEENAAAAFGGVPDAAARQRMRQLIDAMA